MLIVIPGEMWFAAVSGTGDTAAALGIEVVLTVTMLGAAYLAAIHFTWPVALVWISLPAAWLVCLITWNCCRFAACQESMQGVWNRSSSRSSVRLVEK